MNKYKEYKDLDLSEIHKTILNEWNENNIFKNCIEEGNGKPNFTFYEGPPSANGMPGIHHVIARTLKDLFCRYKTLQGFSGKQKGRLGHPWTSC